MKKFFLFFLILLISKQAGSLNSENGILIDGLLVWNEGRKLSWQDFKGLPTPHGHFSAACNWQIDYSYTYEMKGKLPVFNFVVQSYFNQLNSWSKQEEQTDVLLAHEQLHFDIAELHARILRKNLNEGHFSKNNFKAEISKVFREVLDHCHEKQRQYDKESNHGLNKNIQKQWEENIFNEINTYENFSKNIEM